MAITALNIINRAFRLLGIQDASEAAPSADAQDALDTLNAMLAEWHYAEVGLPDYSFSSLTNTLATDAADRDAIAYSLAARIAPEYGTSLSPDANAVGEAAVARMRLRYFEPGTVDFSELPGRKPAFNIETGT